MDGDVDLNDDIARRARAAMWDARDAAAIERARCPICGESPLNYDFWMPGEALAHMRSHPVPSDESAEGDA